MAIIEPIEQILKILEIKKNILLVTKASPSHDAAAGMFALARALAKKGKKVSLAIAQGRRANLAKISFLSEFARVGSELKKEAKIIINFPLNNQRINGLTYKVKDDKLEITIFPEEKNFRLPQPLIEHGAYPYDLVVVIGSPDLESLGRIYEENMELFFSAPLVNIDCRENNEYFGEINLVELENVALCEIIFKIIETWEKNLLDEEIATCLLTGIISESRGFHHPNLTPRTLAIASELINAGGRREQIIRELYANKPVASLRLWGRALASLKTDPNNQIVWSELAEDDFLQTDTDPLILQNVIDDLLANIPQAKAVVVLYRWRGKSQALIYTNRSGVDLRKVFFPLSPAGAGNLIEVSLPQTAPGEEIPLLTEIIINRWPKEMPRF